jgi:H+/Cl- antiporter ClcA
MRITKSPGTILAVVIGLISIAAISIWQFYLFVTFKDSQGLVDVQGGTHHLWWAIGAALVACIAGFLVFSVFVRYDKANEMHITS